MKDKLISGLFLAFFGLFLVFSSCTPCKYVAKHPECVRPDTVKLTEKVIHYETEYIKVDSIIRDTVFCDPTNPITVTKTIYQTKLKTVIDTIYTDKIIDRINPLNEQLKKDNDILIQKNKNKRNLMGISWLIILLFIAIFMIRK